jgi:hypothetical protein
LIKRKTKRKKGKKDFGQQATGCGNKKTRGVSKRIAKEFSPIHTN